jgi:predicted amidohydrolase YtcJ
MRERLLLNADVRTMDPAQPRAAAIVTVGDRIGYVGDAAGARAFAHAGAEEIDLGGAFVIPGFIEAHNHMISFGLGAAQVDARYPGVRSIAEIKSRLGERAARTPAGQWIVARGYDDNKLDERRHPTRQDLDAVAPEHPVVLINGSGHMAVVNSLALRLAGITGTTEPPQGGHIVLDQAAEPTGLLQETAQELVRGLIPPPTTADMVEALRLCGERYAAAGITSSHTAGVNSEQEFVAHQRAAFDGVLPLRTYAMIGRLLLPAIDDLGLMTGFGDDRLKIGPIKLFSDGSLIGRTAALFEPFLDDPRPDNLGLEMMPQEELDAVVKRAHDAGFQVATHAIGDRAIHMVLTAYERALAGNPRPDHRHRIEHCGILRSELIARLARGRFLPVSQPIFIPEYGDGFLRHLGRERCQLTYPFRSLLEAGVDLVFSSDCPVSAFEPLKGIQAAVLERTGTGQPYAPAEAISVEEGLRRYTVAGAYAAFEEPSKGTITVGKLADLAVLAHDPATVPPDRIAEVPVLATIIGGETVYERSQE